MLSVGKGKYTVYNNYNIVTAIEVCIVLTVDYFQCVPVYAVLVFHTVWCMYGK